VEDVVTETSKPHEGLDGPQTAEVGRGAKVAAPIVAGAATWAARKAMDSGFRRATGRPAPAASDLNILPGRIVLWAAVTAVVVTAINVAVDRVMLRPKVRSTA
jgi:Protein of unknown function (DUF4235)